MTALNRRVRRVTATHYRGKALTIDCAPLFVLIREQGRRETSAVLVPWDAIYELGLKLKARADRAAKKAGQP